MREWLYILAPVAAIAYFIAFPRYFIPLLNWMMSIVQWASWAHPSGGGRHAIERFAL